MERQIFWVGLTLCAVAVAVGPVASGASEARGLENLQCDVFLERQVEISGLLPGVVYVVELVRDGDVRHSERAFSDERGRLVVSPPPHHWDGLRGGQVAIYRVPGPEALGLVDVPAIRGEVALAAMWVGVEGARPSDWVYLTIGRETYRTLSTPVGSAYFDLADHYLDPEHLARSGPIMLAQNLETGSVKTVVHQATAGAPRLNLELSAASPGGTPLDLMALPLGVRAVLAIQITDDVGRPLAGAEVYPSWADRVVSTDSRGRAVLGLTPELSGAVTIHAVAAGFTGDTAHAAALGRDDGLIEVVVPSAWSLDRLGVFLFDVSGPSPALVDQAVVFEPATDRIVLVGPTGRPLSLVALGVSGAEGWRWDRNVVAASRERRSTTLSTGDPGLVPVAITGSVGEGSTEVVAALEAVGTPNPPGFCTWTGEVRGDGGAVTLWLSPGTYVAQVHSYIDDGVAYVFAPRPLRVVSPGVRLDLHAMPDVVMAVRPRIPGTAQLSSVEIHLPYSRARGARILVEPGRYQAWLQSTLILGAGPSAWAYTFRSNPAETVVLAGQDLAPPIGYDLRVDVLIGEMTPGAMLRAEAVFSDRHGNRLEEVRTPAGAESTVLYRIVDRSARVVARGTGPLIEMPWPPPGSAWVLEVLWETGPLAGTVMGRFQLDD